MFGNIYGLDLGTYEIKFMIKKECHMARKKYNCYCK